MKRKRTPFVDDGRTIAPMNLPGMPGVPVLPGKLSRRGVKPPGEEQAPFERIELTGGERRAIRVAVVLSMLKIAFVVLGTLGILWLLMLLWMR